MCSATCPCGRYSVTLKPHGLQPTADYSMTGSGVVVASKINSTELVTQVLISCSEGKQQDTSYTLYILYPVLSTDIIHVAISSPAPKQHISFPSLIPAVIKPVEQCTPACGSQYWVPLLSLDIAKRSLASSQTLAWVEKRAWCTVCACVKITYFSY